MVKNYSIKIHNQSPYPLPEYQTIGSSGVDLRANLDAKMIIMPHKVYQIPTGIFLEMPIGVEAQIRARSGLALKHGLSLVNGIGTIDADYRGPLGVPLVNLGDRPFTIRHGDRVAQAVVAPVVQAGFAVVDALDETARGTGGFGSTGSGS